MADRKYFIPARLWGRPPYQLLGAFSTRTEAVIAMIRAEGPFRPGTPPDPFYLYRLTEPEALFWFDDRCVW